MGMSATRQPGPIGQGMNVGYVPRQQAQPGQIPRMNNQPMPVDTNTFQQPQGNPNFNPSMAARAIQGYMANRGQPQRMMPQTIKTPAPAPQTPQGWGPQYSGGY
jgi:hypothetical protein